MLLAIGKMAGATGIGQLAILATLPIVARLYDPSSFGLFALVSSFVGVGSVGACLCLDVAIVQSRTSEAADELCAAALLSVPLTVMVSALIMSVVIAIGWFGYDKLSYWSVPIAALMIGLNGVYIASRYRVLREQRYDVLARATLVQNSGRAIAPIGWGVVLPDWTGLSLGEASGRMLGIWGLLRPILPRLRANAAWGDFGSWSRVIRRESSYTVVLLGSVLMDSTASLLIAPLLAWGYGAAAAGEYFVVANVLVAPSALLGTAIADVIHTRGARLYMDSPRDLPGFLGRMAFWLLVAGSAIYLPVYVLAPVVFPVVFGAEWKLIALIAQAMTPFMIVAFVASPCARMLFAVGRTGWKALSDLIRLLGTPAVMIAATRSDLPFETAIWVLTWFLAAAYAVYFGLTYHATVKASRRLSLDATEIKGH